LGPEGKRKLRLRNLTNDQLIELYDSELVLRLHNAKNLSDTRKILAYFKDHLGNYPPSAELAKSFLARYANKSARTLYRYTQMVKAFMKWYGEPIEDLRIKVPKSIPKYTEELIFVRVRDAIANKKTHKGCVKRDLLLFDLDRQSGLRRGELSSLMVKDIHSDFLEVRKGKGGKDRNVPLASAISIRLQNYIKDNHLKPDDHLFNLTPGSISNKIRIFADKAGVKDVHTHSLRHKFATNLLEQGTNIRVVQDLMGHDNLNTTQVYLSVTDKAKTDAINRLDQRKGINEQDKPTTIKTQDSDAQLIINPAQNDARFNLLLETGTPPHDEVSLYFETPHKQQIRESAITLMDQISFPFIGDRIMDKLTTKMDPKQTPMVKDRFTNDVLMEGLRSHLHTAGYSATLRAIDDFDREDTANIVQCYNFVEFARKEIEQKFQGSISFTDNGEKGVTIFFVQTLCAEAIEKARGSNHYQYFLYNQEGLGLKYGAFLIYRGVEGQDLNSIQAVHRDMRNTIFLWRQAQDIAKQINQINKILETINQQLRTFALLEHIPGNCHLCAN
jgi:site-specific recombinase XerD